MKNVIKYKTAGRSTVVWKMRGNQAGSNDPLGSYECGGCGKEDSGYASTADAHAQNCRAL